MEKSSGIHAVHRFFKQVWQPHPDWDNFEDVVVEDFVFISGGRKNSKVARRFKMWAEGFIAAIGNLEFEGSRNIFEKCDQSQ